MYLHLTIYQNSSIKFAKLAKIMFRFSTLAIATELLLCNWPKLKLIFNIPKVRSAMLSWPSLYQFSAVL